VLHVDRSFTVKGAGTVVTGTLWRGAIARGDEVVLLPEGRRTRVRSVQEHDEARESATAGRRVALNLVGVEVRDVGRGDVVAAPAAGLEPSHLLDVALDVRLDHGSRVQVHHGTREVAARVGWLGGRFHQLRCEAPLVAARGDRVVIRSVAAPDTLGGGVVLDPRPRKHGPSNDVLVRLSRMERGEEVEPERRAGAQGDPAAPRERDVPIAPPPLDAHARALEERFRAAGPAPPPDADLDEDARASLFALREAERVVRLGKGQHVHTDALAEVERVVREICEAEGEIGLARLRDELGIGRRHAQVLLERLDSDRVTLRVGDARRLRGRRAS
jgi:selenocysteine-specific elongation factor